MYITDYTGTRLLFLLYLVVISSTAPSRLRLTLLTRAGGACARALGTPASLHAPTHVNSIMAPVLLNPESPT